MLACWTFSPFENWIFIPATQFFRVKYTGSIDESTKVCRSCNIRGCSYKIWANCFIATNLAKYSTKYFLCRNSSSALNICCYWKYCIYLGNRVRALEFSAAKCKEFSSICCEIKTIPFIFWCAAQFFAQYIDLFIRHLR